MMSNAPWGDALKPNTHRCGHGELKVQKHHQVTSARKNLHLVTVSDLLKKNRARSWTLNFVKTRSTYSNAGPLLRWEAAVKRRFPQTSLTQALTTTATYMPWLLSPCSQTFFYSHLTVNIPGEGGHDTHICWHMHFHKMTQNFRDLLYSSNIMWKIYFQSLQMQEPINSLKLTGILTWIPTI